MRDTGGTKPALPCRADRRFVVEVGALCDTGDLLYSADIYGIVRAWAGVREGTPRLVSELSTNSPTKALLPLAAEHIAVVSTNGLAVVRCNAH
jgi:hypothetical protein